MEAALVASAATACSIDALGSKQQLRGDAWGRHRGSTTSLVSLSATPPVSLWTSTLLALSTAPAQLLQGRRAAKRPAARRGGGA
jgi:hypothetical protein